MSGPVLSNWLNELAGRVAGDVAAYKRASTEAHRAYLSAGAALVEARGACRRGQWGVFLAACGLQPAVARNMMQLTRAGLTAEDIGAAGGVQAALTALREAARGAVDAAAEAGEIPQSNCGNDEAEGVPERPVAALPGQPGRRPAPPTPAGSPTAAKPATEPRLSPAARRRALRLARRERGECVDCGASSGSASRCGACRSARARSTARARTLRTIGRTLEPRIRRAAESGRGLRLTPADIAGLAGEGEGR